MRKIFLSMMVTLDGYFEGPNREIDWHVVGNEFNDFASSQLDSVDTILFGRVTYQMMADYWPTHEAIKNDPVIANKMNNIHKVAFSKTLEKVQWQNTSLINKNTVEEVRKLKAQPGRDMVIFGSSDLSAALTDNGLIDEYRIFVNPILLGGGKALLKGINERVKLKLLWTKIFGTGLVLFCYEPENVIKK
jgi:dihydrofolate reductase